jgi:predicted small metal-binding protein
MYKLACSDVGVVCAKHFSASGETAEEAGDGLYAHGVIDHAESIQAGVKSTGSVEKFKEYLATQAKQE